MKTKVISIFLIIVFLYFSCYCVFGATIDELRRQEQEIKNNISNAEGQKQEIVAEKDKELKEIYELQEKITQSENELKEIEDKLTDLNESITKKTKQIAQKEKEYAKNKELLEVRLAVMYEKGETSFLEILLKSSNLIEFLSNYYNFNQVVECDKELLTNIEKQKDEIEQSKNELEKEKVEVEKLKVDKEAKTNQLRFQRQEHQNKVNALNEEQRKIQARIDEANKKEKQIEAEITKELQKIERQGANSNGIHFDGSFVWPCTGRYITSTMKIRWGRLHKGIDIGINHQEVYATASGYAYTRNNPGGYGYYVIIVHGNNYVSLYGHLSSYRISDGQYVSQGQVIGISGGRVGEPGAGSSTGAHLHFEIRRTSSLSNYFNVSPLNPLDYLPGGYTLGPGAATPSYS